MNEKIKKAIEVLNSIENIITGCGYKCGNAKRECLKLHSILESILAENTGRRKNEG